MWFVFLMALVLGGLRLVGVTHIAFQAAAHFFMGGLIVAWWKGRSENNVKNWQLIAVFGFLTVLETLCFFFGPLIKLAN